MKDRQDIAMRVLARWRSAGFPIDDYPEIALLIQRWIEGKLTARDMQQLCLEILKSRRYTQK